MKFADKLLLLRQENHMTQQDLAGALGISRRAVAAYETEGALPRRSTLRKLAQVFQVSYDYLTEDSVTDPAEGLKKNVFLDLAEDSVGAGGALEVRQLLEANQKLFAGGDLSEEGKELFYQAVTRAYIQCKLEAMKKYGHAAGHAGETAHDS